MLVIDLKGHTTTSALQASKSITETANSGAKLDTLEYTGTLLAVLNVGAVTGTSPTLDVKIQDSADNSTFADVTGLAFSQVTEAGLATLSIDTRAVKRYVQAVLTVGGTNPVFPVSMTVTGFKQTV